MEAMRKVILMALALFVWTGCQEMDEPQAKEFTHTGCASGAMTKAAGDAENLSLLILRYEDGDLRVTRTNARMNCSIKQGGIVCESSVDGNVIHYKVYEKDGPNANCICLVEEMSSVVTGLKPGKEYTFDYYCSYGYTPFTFVFKKGLRLVKEEDSILPF